MAVAVVEELVVLFVAVAVMEDVVVLLVADLTDMNDEVSGAEDAEGKLKLLIYIIIIIIIKCCVKNSIQKICVQKLTIGM